ncbi:ATP-dependent DNA ligase [Mesorhizobium sp. 1B3]|uniref:ATP-dependent DNA ligase n=1 Tax=Mesorhizobium sp. 1B3 TaxID=3243599 RepID=UPI003D9885E6
MGRAAKPANDPPPGLTATGQAVVEPMEARLVDDLPNEPVWQFEPKWDGFRCLAYRKGELADLRAKSGKPLGRYFPEVIRAVLSAASDDFIIDGELAIPIGETLAFDALQMRLHPAESRIRKLSSQTPAIFILFDILRREAGDIVHATLAERRAVLETLFREMPPGGLFRLSPYTRDRNEAMGWLEHSGGALDGVVAKRVDGRYEYGERSMLKVKRLRSADCVVGGFRYASDSRLVGSLLLGLFDSAGLLHHVGFTSTISNEERPSLTKRLEALTGAPGFTGNAPGGPSRWSTERSAEWQPLRHELVVEVRYDQVTGDRFRHGTKLLRWRPDKAPRQCTFDQIEREARPGKLIQQLVAA